MTLLQQRWTGSRPGLRRILRIVVIVALIALLLPYLLTPLYLVVRPVSMPMLWRYVTFQPVTRIYRPLDDIAAVLPRTVIASEDAQFCNHHGIDWRGLRDIIKDALPSPVGHMQHHDNVGPDHAGPVPLEHT